MEKSFSFIFVLLQISGTSQRDFLCSLFSPFDELGHVGFFFFF